MVAALGIAAVAAGVAMLAPAEGLAQGCAMCATYLSNGTDPRANAFKTSIIFLMCMPFVTVLSAGGWIVWMTWRSRPRRPVLRVLRAEGGESAMSQAAAVGHATVDTSEGPLTPDMLMRDSYLR